MGEQVLIIGAGVSGLSAGCYARMNGFVAHILEMHTAPGGLCAGWRRDGYTIDGCVHWLVGSSPSHGLYRLWEELGVVPGLAMYRHDALLRVEDIGGETLVLHSDIDLLERHLLELAPEDSGLIREFTGGVRRLGRLTRSCAQIGRNGRRAPMQPWRLPGTLRALLSLRRWDGVSVSEFAESFESPLLREGLSRVVEVPEFPVAGLMMTLAWQNERAAGYPLGGSQALAGAVERRFLRLGGTVEYGRRVNEILVEDNRAVGVRLDDGTERRADAVISSIDAHATLFDLLGGGGVNRRVRRRYEALPPFPPLLQVAFGVPRSVVDVPPTALGIDFPLEESVCIDGRRCTRLAAQVYSFDPEIAPPGRTVVKVAVASDFERWTAVAEDPERYRDAKRAAADAALAALAQRFPGIATRVEARDVATPVTWARHTGNWQGSFEGWLRTTRTTGRAMAATLPGLGGFQMIGQWVVPGGGLPAVAASGREAVRRLCNEYGRRFTTAVPGDVQEEVSVDDGRAAG